MRVTEGMRHAEIVRNLTRIGAQHADASRQAMTGMRIDRPSKDPIAAAELARLRASLSNNAAYRETISLVRGDAALAEATLAEGSDLLSRAREIAMAGANGTLGAEERSVMALEVRGLRDELIRLANTRGTKGYIFSGSQTNVAAFDANGAFQGDEVQQALDIGSSAPLQVGASGARAFTATGGRDVFADLATLSAALEANDPSGISATLDALANSQAQITSERARVGLQVGRMDTSNAILEHVELEQARRQEEIGAADPFQAYSLMTALSGSLERSVAVSRQLLDLTGLKRF